MNKIQFHGQIREISDSLWPVQLAVPKEIAEEAISAFNGRRVRCTIAEHEEFSAALMPDGLAGFYIMLNKERARKWNLKSGLELPVILKPETAEYGMPMSDEMAAVLEADPEALAFFRALTPGKQRSLIYIVSKIKSAQNRLNKSIIIARFLVESGGVLDYKALHQAFKEGI